MTYKAPMTAERSCLRTQQELDGWLKDYNALVRKDGTIPPKATTTFMFNQIFVKGSEDYPKCKCGKCIAEHPNALKNISSAGTNFQIWQHRNDFLGSVVDWLKDISLPEEAICSTQPVLDQRGKGQSAHKLKAEEPKKKRNTKIVAQQSGRTAMIE